MTPCPLCRTEIDDADPRCASCGTHIQRDAAPVPPPAGAGGPAYFGASPRVQSHGTAVLSEAYPLAPPPHDSTWFPPPVPPKKRGIARTLAIGGIVVACLVAVLAVIGIVGRAVDNKRANDAIDAYAAGRTGKLFTSAPGSFAAQFPTAPVPVEQTIKAQGGTQFVFHDFISRPGRRYAFEVGYFDFAPGIRLPDARAALTAMVDAMAGELKGHVTRSVPSLLARAQAEDFTVQFDDRGQQAMALGRVALRGTRVYLVAVTAPGLQPAAFDRLVASFEFTPPGA
ncbi:MAG: hypothetical protein QOI55_2797 [Actinomycetota bacterium]|nr:hypothetical protein [Actinomycetota bacterium]